MWRLLYLVLLQRCCTEHLYILQLVLQICPLSFEHVSLVQGILKALGQTENVALLQVHLLLELSLLSGPANKCLKREIRYPGGHLSNVQHWLIALSTSSISLCFSSLSVSSFCCKLRAFISSMACFFSRSLSCHNICARVNLPHRPATNTFQVKKKRYRRSES